MKEIETNEYVRTKEGFIYRIENGEEFYADSVDVGMGIIPDVDGIWIDRECLDYIDKRDIVKHSKQLIDLIEVGDYVNGMEVLDIYKPRVLWDPIEIRVDSRYTNFILADEIKKILTKEQFEANCYKAGGKDE